MQAKLRFVSIISLHQNLKQFIWIKDACILHCTAHKVSIGRQQPLLPWNFWADYIYCPPWTIIVHGSKGNLGQIWKGAKSPKPENHTHQNWLACISHRPEYFEPILFFDLHGLKESMVWKGNFAVFESTGISKTGRAMPTKIGVHACYIKAYLHKFFKPIPIT